MNRYLSFAVLLGIAASAGAGVDTSFEKVNTVDLGGTTYKVWDMKVYTPSDWTNTRMDLLLTSGTLYQDPDGSDIHPNPGFFMFVPSLEWDTYLTVPSGYPAPVSFAGAPPWMTDTSITASWFDTVNDGPGIWKIARVTLSSDAYGTITGSSWDMGPAPAVCCPLGFEFTIMAGEIVPEPATIALLALGAVALLRRRRR
jgi:hypothetical protein